jgi:diguanylate cyclase (GGDEF)-like protein
MRTLAPSTEFFQRQPWLALTLSAVLVVGATLTAHHAWMSLPLTVPLMLCVIGLSGVCFLLYQRWRTVCAQRDHALHLASGMDWPICEGLKNKNPCTMKCALQRVNHLQNEVSSLHARKQQLEVLAHHDSLTGLANRVLLAEHFRVNAKQAMDSGESFGLVMIDLDRFKSINDSYGHASGDQVLVTSAQRLLATISSSATVARLGGDEFAVMVAPVSDSQQLALMGEQLSKALSQPITLTNGQSVSVGLSLGFALYPDDGGTLSDLLHVADQAMYECKSSGFSCLEV